MQFLSHACLLAFYDAVKRFIQPLHIYITCKSTLVRLFSNTQTMQTSRQLLTALIHLNVGAILTIIAPKTLEHTRIS